MLFTHFSRSFIKPTLFHKYLEVRFHILSESFEIWALFDMVNMQQSLFLAALLLFYCTKTIRIRDFILKQKVHLL